MYPIRYHAILFDPDAIFLSTVHLVRTLGKIIMRDEARMNLAIRCDAFLGRTRQILDQPTWKQQQTKRFAYKLDQNLGSLLDICW